MRLEELAYEIGPNTVNTSFHRRFTVVSGLSGPARAKWAERALGVLFGTPAGDGASLVFTDGPGNRVRLMRDKMGGAELTDLATGEELAFAAAELALDGRFDWFAFLGLTTDAARAIMLLDAVSLDRGEGFEPAEGGPTRELLEARDVLARVQKEFDQVTDAQRHLLDLRTKIGDLDHQIRNFDEELARRRHGRAFQSVQRLETELARLTGDELSDQIAAAALEAARTAGEWRAAAAALEAARSAFGDRRRLDPKAVQHSRHLPVEVPAGLDGLQAAYLTAAERRAEFQARLDEGTANELPAPSAPWVLTLARAGDPEHPDLWVRAERVRVARIRAAELSMGLGGAGRHRDLVAEIEMAHQAVEEAERDIADARIPGLAVAAKRRLTKAKEEEQSVLNRAGIVSWLSFQMRRIDVLLEPDALEALRVAELEHQLASAAWCEMAGDVDPEAALAARSEIERYSAKLDATETSIDATEALRRQLVEEVEPAYTTARDALLQACQAFDVDPEHAASEVDAIVAEARHARLQETLDEAESAYRTVESRLESQLAAAGLPGPPNLADRVEAVVVLAAEATERLEAVEADRPLADVEAELAAARDDLARLAHPEWDEAPFLALDPDAPEPDTRTLTAERDRLAAEAERAERTLPDAERLADRLDALGRRVAILENASGTGPNLLTFEEAEMVLLGRLAQARRVGRHSEALPILVDDALAAFARHDKRRLLDLLSRLSEASQIVYLTEDRETIEWAETRTEDGRVAVLRADVVPSAA